MLFVNSYSNCFKIKTISKYQYIKCFPRSDILTLTAYQVKDYRKMSNKFALRLNRKNYFKNI